MSESTILVPPMGAELPMYKSVLMAQAGTKSLPRFVLSVFRSRPLEDRILRDLNKPEYVRSVMLYVMGTLDELAAPFLQRTAPVRYGAEERVLKDAGQPQFLGDICDEIDIAIAGVHEATSLEEAGPSIIKHLTTVIAKLLPSGSPERLELRTRRGSTKRKSTMMHL